MGVNLPADITGQALHAIILEWAEGNLAAAQRRLKFHTERRAVNKRKVPLQVIAIDEHDILRCQHWVNLLQDMCFVEGYAFCPSDHEEPAEDAI